MKPNTKFVAALISLACLTIALTAGAKTAAQNAAPVQNEIFRDKFVTVYLDDPLKGSGLLMKDARLEKVGDRWFLLGTAASSGQAGEWDEGLTAGASWDDVTAFYTFTAAQFDEKIKAKIKDARS